jgi:hypothetical protein
MLFLDSDSFQLLWHWTLWVFVFKVLLVRLRVRHLGLADGTAVDKSSGCRFLLVSSLTLLQFSLFLCILLLRLDLLLSSGHQRAYILYLNSAKLR